MNYLKEIIGFERLAELKSLGAPERVVWYALMSIANTLGWPETFNVPNVTLQSKTGLSRNDVYIARNKLSQKGFIEYKASTGNRAPSYGLISTINTQTDTQINTQTDTQTDTQTQHKLIHKPIHKPVPYSKLNKTKLNEEDGARDAFTVTDEEAQAHREMIDRIEAKAKSYGLPFATGDIDKALDLAGEYTEEWLLAAIDRCSDRTNRNWGIVKGILRSWKEGGGMDKGYREEVSVNWA